MIVVDDPEPEYCLATMAAASGVDVEIEVAAVPFLAGGRWPPRAAWRNGEWVADSLDAGGHDELDVLLLADAQTSGGQLFGAATRPGRATTAGLCSAPETYTHLVGVPVFKTGERR